MGCRFEMSNSDAFVCSDRGLHKVRELTREEYYAMRSQWRRTQHIIQLRYAAATCDRNTVTIPAEDDVLPEKFK